MSASRTDTSPSNALQETAGWQADSSSEHFSQHNATATVKARTAPRRPSPAFLVDVSPDTLRLHTRDAFWMFIGRRANKERNEHSIVGGQRAAAALNAMRHMSVGGNPYADWFLLRFEEQLRELRERFAATVQESEAGFEALRQKGLALTVLGSRHPLELTVAFGSSYGYAIAEVILEFDYYVRIIKTLVLKNRITPDEASAAIRAVGRPLRRLFVWVIRSEYALRARPLTELTRGDFLASADESARERVLHAVQRFGQIPEDILAARSVPRHVTRRGRAKHAEPPNGSTFIEAADGRDPDAELV